MARERGGVGQVLYIPGRVRYRWDGARWVLIYLARLEGRDGQIAYPPGRVGGCPPSLPSVDRMTDPVKIVPSLVKNNVVLRCVCYFQVCTGDNTENCGGGQMYVTVHEVPFPLMGFMVEVVSPMPNNTLSVFDRIEVSTSILL